MQHTAGLVAPNGITGTQFPPFHSSFFNISKSFEHFQSKPELEMVGLCHLEVNIKLCVEYV